MEIRRRKRVFIFDNWQPKKREDCAGISRPFPVLAWKQVVDICQFENSEIGRRDVHLFREEFKENAKIFIEYGLHSFEMRVVVIAFTPIENEGIFLKLYQCDSISRLKPKSR